MFLHRLNLEWVHYFASRLVPKYWFVPNFTFTPNDESIITQIDVQHGAMSVYYKGNEENECGGEAYNFLTTDQFRYGPSPSYLFLMKDQHRYHDLWHQDALQIEQPHRHLYNNFFRITSENMNAFVQQMHDYEKETGLCQDGHTRCLLTTTDSSTLLKNYKNYYDFNSEQDAIYEPLNNFYVTATVITLHSFLYTLSEQLLQQRRGGNLVRLAREVISSGLIFWFTESPSAALTYFIMQQTIQFILDRIHVDGPISKSLLNMTSLLLTLTRDPTRPIELEFNSIAALIGIGAACSANACFNRAQPIRHTDEEGTAHTHPHHL